MSTTLSTSAMVTQMQQRIPIGLSSTFCMARLNESYRWLCQRGDMQWLIKRATVVASGLSPSTFTLPADFDPGAGCFLSTSGVSNLYAEIPFVPWDDALKHQYYDVAMSAGEYSCWSFQTDTGYLFPTPAPLGPTGHLFVYHSNPGTPLTSGAGTYFPTPDAFDTLLIDMACAATMSPSWYRLNGWDVVQKTAQDQALALLERYRTTKATILGAVEQAKKANEVAAVRAG